MKKNSEHINVANGRIPFDASLFTEIEQESKPADRVRNASGRIPSDLSTFTEVKPAAKIDRRGGFGATITVPVISAEPVRYSLPAHPYCDTFPLMTDIRELVEDIRRNGLADPIVVHNGQIVDGRNRDIACGEAGVERWYVEWDEIYHGPMTVERWIWSKNVQRRHLTPAQVTAAYVIAERWGLRERASLAQADGRRLGGQTAGRGRPKVDSLLAKPPASSSIESGSVEDEAPPANAGTGAKGHSVGRRQEVAEACGVTDYIARQALDIERSAPELLDEVAQGKISLPKAAKRARVHMAGNAVGSKQEDGNISATAFETRLLPNEKLEELIKRAVRAVEKALSEVPEEQRDTFKAEVAKTLLLIA